MCKMTVMTSFIETHFCHNGIQHTVQVWISPVPTGMLEVDGRCTSLNTSLKDFSPCSNTGTNTEISGMQNDIQDSLRYIDSIG